MQDASCVDRGYSLWQYARAFLSIVARKYSYKKYISVFTMTLGIILFQLMSSRKKVSATSNSNLGLLLLLLSLCMDGVCGAQQDVVVTRFKPSSLRLQQMLNVYGVVVSFIASLFLQELKPGLLFLLRNKVCLGVGVYGW